MINESKEKYINPYTDFGFKKLFGTEMNKDLLISFLNALFSDSEKEIEDVQRPVALQERIFTKLFEQAEIAKYTTEERREYEASVKNYWDYFSTMKTAAQNASNSRAIEIAREMKKDGMSSTLIAKYTGLSIEQIEAL